MDKTEFVIRTIQHEADFPIVKPITLASAQTLIDSTLPAYLPTGITAAEIVDLWNQLILDPAVMEPSKLITD